MGYVRRRVRARARPRADDRQRAARRERRDRQVPGLAGSVKTVDASGFWRDKAVSANDRQDHHYFHNAETYLEVGNALGLAIAELLGKR